MFPARTFFVLTSLALLPRAAPAQAVPAPVAEALLTRDKALSHLTFTWQRAVKETVLCTLSPAELAEMKHKMEVGTAADYRKHGVTDEAQIKRDTQTATESVMTAMKGGSVAYSNVWSFRRDGSPLLLSGTVQTFYGFTGTYQHFYDGPAALTRFVSAHFSVGDVTMPPQHPVAYKTSGDSLYYEPLSSGLDLNPEHLALLLGTNPLLLRGLTWTVQSQTPTALTLKSHFTSGYTGHNIQMTLAVKSGYAPTEIVVRRSSVTERWTAAHLRRYNDVWVSDKVLYFYNAPGFSFTAQTWTLQTLTPSVPIDFPIPATQPVWDYRLVGADLPERMFSHIGIQRDLNAQKVRRYAWPGHFLPEAELTKMFETGQGKVY